MSRKEVRKPRRKKSKSLAQHGWALCGLGIFLISLPLFFGNSLVAQAFGSLKYFGLVLLFFGSAILAFAWWRKLSLTPAQPDDLPARSSVKTEPFANERSAAPSPAGVIAHERSAQASQSAASPNLRATAWSTQVFEAIEWRRFEAVCEALFAQAGFETKSQSHGADGGVDIWLHSRSAAGPVAVVQCKHWRGKPVGVKELREFLGVMASHQLKRGTYATSSRYTADAQEFAKNNGINALDGGGLLALIAKRTPEQQQTLLDVVYEGDYWRPTCASCGVKMLERKPAKGGAAFWGCANFPRCRSTLPMLNQ
jgi:restriction system protein